MMNATVFQIEDPLGHSSKCDCWANRIDVSNVGTDGLESEWLSHEHWVPEVFSNAPSKTFNRARVCWDNGSVVHLMSGLEHCVDLKLIANDSAESPTSTAYVQYGYCKECKMIEWHRFHDRMPRTPIIWLSGCENKMK